MQTFKKWWIWPTRFLIFMVFGIVIWFGVMILLKATSPPDHTGQCTESVEVVYVGHRVGENGVDLEPVYDTIINYIDCDSLTQQMWDERRER